MNLPFTHQPARRPLHSGPRTLPTTQPAPALRTLPTPAAIEEAERILQAILAKRASEEAAAHPEEKSNTDTSQDHNQDLRPIS